MSKFDESIISYQTFLSEKLGDKKINNALLTQIAQELGPAIYDADASLVACSDKGELSRVKEFFLLNRLGLTASPALDEAIKSVCQTMGSSNRRKFRVVFYYLLVKHFKLETTFVKPTAKETGATKSAAPKTAAKSAAKETVVAKPTATKTSAKPATKEAAVVKPEAAKSVAKPTAKETAVAKPAAAKPAVASQTVAHKATAVNSLVSETVAASAVQMPATFDEAIDAYKTFLNEKYPDHNVDEHLLKQITYELGTAIHHPDASLIATSDESELSRVKQYFLLGRLGLADSPALDKTMSEVAETMGKSNRRKSRAVFYYLLTKYFDAEQTILTPVDGNLY